MSRICVGFVMCGSFCTFSKAIEQMIVLKESGFDVLPIMSQNAYTTDTRFGKAAEINQRIKEICGRDIIHTIEQAEPIGPKRLTDVMVIAPCTGNTVSKLSAGITDTPATMAAKSHLRTLRPLILAIATNDALGASAQSIGRMMNVKNVYFVPFSQDNPEKKPKSIVAHFDLIPQTIAAALDGKQIQPVLA